ncbi:MAG: ribonuclease P protein component [Bacteroidales bacterium]|nr:ribonuclease P protein component [Bacteroidales bacterium]
MENCHDSRARKLEVFSYAVLEHRIICHVAGCLRYKFLKSGEADASRILVSVPKRFFKRAVKRNLLKRRIRESYRLQKDLLPVPVDIAFLYQDREVLPFSDIFAAMTAVLTAVAAKTE